MRLLIFFLLIFFTSCSIRKPQGYSKTFRDACVKMDEQSWSSAAASWQVLLKTDPDNANLNYKLGQCFFMLNQDSLAVLALEKACTQKFSRSYDAYDYAENKASVEAKLMLGKAYARTNRLTSAKRVLDELVEDLPEKHRANKEVRQEIKAVNTARNAFTETNEIKVSQLEWEEAYAPCPSIDGSILYMGLNSRVAVSKRQADGSWSIPQILPSSFENEYPGYMRPNATQLWTVRTNLLYSINNGDHELIPFKGDRIVWFGETAYVSRQNKTSSDIFVITNGIETPFKYNTKWTDDVAGISIDGKTLYVASNRPGTMGMQDIFAVDIKTGIDVNLGYPINSTRDDLWYSPSGGGIAYMSSDRGGKFKIYKCVSKDKTSDKVVRGFVSVIGKNKTVRIKAPELDVVSSDGSFIYVAKECQSIVFEYEIEGVKAGTDTISTPCRPGYEEVIFETYLMPYTPKPIVQTEVISITKETPEIKLKTKPILLTPAPAPKQNMPSWFTDTEYNPEKPVQFQYSDTIGIALFERYFTYGGQEFSAAETRFAEFIGAIGLMTARGTVEISINASASKVPSKRYVSNNELALNRAENAKKQIIDALSILGYIEGTDYVITDVHHEVGGRQYKNDAQVSKEIYEQFQYVKIKAIIRK